MPLTKRKIVKIDEDLCDGCGACIPGCAEGAIRIIDGKAKLIADRLCDGLGNCLGTCPRGAVTIEERHAEEFDALAVERHQASSQAEQHAPAGPPAGGCPGSRMRKLQGPASGPKREPAEAETADRTSRLGHWPVQLTLVPPVGEVWQDADVLIAADCVPTAMPDFHEKLLDGRTVAIACPKLDDLESYVEKLTVIFSKNEIRSVTVAHMEVPCCSGIVGAVEEALRRADREEMPLRDVTARLDGTLHD